MAVNNEVEVGQKAELSVEITEQFISDFAAFSGDNNPLHVDGEYAKKTKYKRRIAHGLSYASMFSQLIGMKLLGAGALWISQRFVFEKPVCIGDALNLSVEVKNISRSTGIVSLDCRVLNQDRETILTGEGEVTLLDEEVGVSDLEASTRNGWPEHRLSLVVAGSRGIGASVVRKLAANGHSVSFTFLKSDAEANRLEHENVGCVGFKADATDRGSADKLIEGILKKFGRLPDTIVFCASANPLVKPVEVLGFEPFAKHLAVGLEHCHELVRHCLPNFIKHRFGRIVVIGTTYTESTPPAGMGPYIVGKAALAAFIRSIAVDYGRFGIRANIVAPSMTETALLSTLPDRERKVSAQRNPVRRLAVPEDIAGAVSFLVSEDSDYVNGETLVVSGGSIIR